MKTTKMLLRRLALLAISILTISCERISVENKLYGSWDVSFFASNADFEKLSKEPISGVSKEEYTIRIEGTQIYHRGGKYDFESEITLRYEINPPLRFHLREVGDWSLHANGKDIVETTSDSVINALDEFSEEAMPDFAAWLKPLRGQTITKKILSISDTVLMVQEDDETKFTITMKKRR